MNEKTKNQLKLYELKLENKNEYIQFNLRNAEKIINDYNEESDKDTKTVTIIGIVLGGLIAFVLFGEESTIFLRFIGCCFGAWIARLFYAMCHPEVARERNEIEKTINDLEEQIKNHNANLFNNYIVNKLKEYNIQNISKEIVLQASYNSCEKILIDDENKTFNLVKFTMPKNMEDSSSFSIKQVKYSEILRYVFLDKSTTTQVATSTTSSNSKKAIGGAVATKLLIGDATAGAVIGGSGARTTETTYKTKKIRKYQITIYLNKLEDSLITINLESGNITNQIISTLEYILRNK